MAHTRSKRRVTVCLHHPTLVQLEGTQGCQEQQVQPGQCCPAVRTTGQCPPSIIPSGTTGGLVPTSIPPGWDAGSAQSCGSRPHCSQACPFTVPGSLRLLPLDIPISAKSSLTHFLPFFFPVLVFFSFSFGFSGLLRAAGPTGGWFCLDPRERPVRCDVALKKRTASAPHNGCTLVLLF